MALAAALMLFVSCSDRPKGVLSDDEMTELLTEMTLAEAARQNGGTGRLPDSVRRNLGEAILARHGYTYARLDTSLAWYGKHLDKYYDMYADVDKRLQKMQRNSSRDYSSVSASSDDNLWPYSDYMIISPLGTVDGIIFSIPSGSLKKGESLEWRMRLNGVYDGKSLLGVQYEDGSVSSTGSALYGSRNIDLTLVTDTGKNVRRIFGSVNIDRQSMPAWADSIRLLKTPYDSVAYYRIHTQRRYK